MAPVYSIATGGAAPPANLGTGAASWQLEHVGTTFCFGFSPATISIGTCNTLGNVLPTFLSRFDFALLIETGAQLNFPTSWYVLPTPRVRAWLGLTVRATSHRWLDRSSLLLPLAPLACEGNRSASIFLGHVSVMTRQSFRVNYSTAIVDPQ